MSTYWGYQCKRDGATSEQWFNHGEHILRDCVKVWPYVKKIREESTSGSIEIHIMGYQELNVLWNFLEEHFEHGIELYSEYGEFGEIELTENPYHGIPHWQQAWALLHEMGLDHALSSDPGGIYVKQIYLGTVEEVAKMTQEDVKEILFTSFQQRRSKN